MGAQWKNTGEFFKFHSILYLCIMNMLGHSLLLEDFFDYGAI